MNLVYFPCGGLGNLLFCHANAFAFAKQNGLHLQAFINQGNSERPSILIYKISIFKHLDFVQDTDYNNYYREPEYKYHEIPKEARVLDGYFQSYKYSYDYQDEITDLLRSNCSETVSKMKTMYQDISEGLDTICVHIRRGDYFKTPDIHPIMSEDYYQESLSKFDTSNKVLIIFSENSSEIENWKVWENKKVHFVNVPDPVETLFLMSMCTHFIIANSSLSLYAYYMRENKSAQIEYPKNWFGPNGPSFDLNDLIPPHN